MSMEYKHDARRQPNHDTKCSDSSGSGWRLLLRSPAEVHRFLPLGSPTADSLRRNLGNQEVIVLCPNYLKLLILSALGAPQRTQMPLGSKELQPTTPHTLRTMVVCELYHVKSSSQLLRRQCSLSLFESSLDCGHGFLLQSLSRRSEVAAEHA